MILFISNSGETLPFVWRLRQEGEEAHIYIHHSRYKHNYDGLIEKTPLRLLLQKIKQAEVIVFDLVRHNEGTKEDRNFAKLFKLPKQTIELFGAAADRIRDKYPDKLVIAPCRETALWELDRFKGTEIAKQVGLSVPKSERFYSLSEGVKFLSKQKSLWVFKPLNNEDLDLTYVEKFPGELVAKFQGEYKRRLGDKIDYILQQVVKGDEISTEGWWDGEKFVYMNHTVEDKRLMNGNLGPAIGSQNNTVWLKKDETGFLMDVFERLADVLSSTTHRGPIDVNCIVDKRGRPWFLEWSVRCGWDALYCLAMLVKGRLKSLFTFEADFYDGFASSERLTIPPFPYTDEVLLKNLAMGVEIKKGFTFPEFWAEDIRVDKGKIVCSGSDGILGVVAARGNSLGGSVGNVYRVIEKMQVASYLQYRTDLGKRAKTVLNRANQIGVSYA